MTKHKTLLNALAAGMISLLSVPAFSAIRPAGDDAIKGVAVDLATVMVGARTMQEYCEENPKSCGVYFPRQLATLPANNLVHLASLNDGDDALESAVKDLGLTPGRHIEIGCIDTEERRCIRGQQMGGDPFDPKYGSNHGPGPRGQQMGPDWKEWERLQEKVVNLQGLLW